MQFNVFVVLLVEITNVKKQFKEKLSFAHVLKSVQKYCEQIKRNEYNEERWATDRDGYLIRGTCYEKLSGEICTNCFCKICYVSVDEWCDCISE